jgi:hypothetical protein
MKREIIFIQKSLQYNLFLFITFIAVSTGQAQSNKTFQHDFVTWNRFNIIYSSKKTLWLGLVSMHHRQVNNLQTPQLNLIAGLGGYNFKKKQITLFAGMETGPINGAGWLYNPLVMLVKTWSKQKTDWQLRLIEENFIVKKIKLDDIPFNSYQLTIYTGVNIWKQKKVSYILANELLSNDLNGIAGQNRFQTGARIKLSGKISFDLLYLNWWFNNKEAADRMEHSIYSIAYFNF